MNEEENCISKQEEKKKTIMLAIIITIVCIASIIIASNITIYDKPKIDAKAKQGTPQVEEQYEYSSLDINDGYSVALCGKPKLENNQLDIYITNQENNDIGLKAQVLDEEENVLGETGLLHPNQYVQSVKLKETIQKGSNIKIKIMEYEMDTYHSKGSVTLKLTI